MTITINITVTRGLLEAIEKARLKEAKKKGKIPSRSEWARDALEKKLNDSGVKIDE